MKKILTIILASLYLVSLPVISVNAQSTDGSRPATMYLSPASGSVALNSAGEFAVDIMVNTGGLNASGVDSHISFEKTKLAFVSGSYPGVGTGTFFPYAVVSMPSTTNANTSGRISMARTIQTPAAGDPFVYTNATGTFARLVFKPLSGITSATLTFDPWAGTTDCNVAGTVVGSDILGSVSNATYTFTAPPPPYDDDPEITSIVPEEGDEDTETELVIFGRNFGSEDGHVYIGTRLAEIVAWSDSEITVIVPAISVTHDSAYQVKVKRTDNKIATYNSFTIVDTGLAGILWMGLIPFNGAAAILIKRRWFTKKEAEEAVSIPIQVIG